MRFLGKPEPKFLWCLKSRRRGAKAHVVTTRQARDLVQGGRPFLLIGYFCGAAMRYHGTDEVVVVESDDPRCCRRCADRYSDYQRRSGAHCTRQSSRMKHLLNGSAIIEVMWLLPAPAPWKQSPWHSHWHLVPVASLGRPLVVPLPRSVCGYTLELVGARPSVEHPERACGLCVNCLRNRVAPVRYQLAAPPDVALLALGDV